MSEPNKPDPASWRKSTASVSGECVEVAGSRSAVIVRDSQDRDGALLTFPDSAWREFISGLAGRP